MQLTQIKLDSERDKVLYEFNSNVFAMAKEIEALRRRLVLCKQAYVNEFGQFKLKDQRHVS